MKMDDDELLSLLRKKEDDAGHYVWGELGTQRELSMREYHRMPYGNEEDGWSQIVSSDIQDTVEWILPSLLKIFTSTDKAVSFEPTRSNDVAGAEQATEACNYVFYKQNNGFMVLYTGPISVSTVCSSACSISVLSPSISIASISAVAPLNGSLDTNCVVSLRNG